MKENIILIGTGQHFNVVLYNLRAQDKYEVACAIDANIENRGKYINEIYIEETYDDLIYLKKKYKTNKFFIAFGNMKYRRETYSYFVSQGWEAVNIIHPDAVVSSDAKLGKGILIECGCLVTPNPEIRDNVVINTGSQVNHDNVIESHVYIASGVILSGGVKIKQNTLLDDGVIVTLGRTVGENCVVGAGAVVTKDTNPNMVIYGNPAREIRTNENIGK